MSKDVIIATGNQHKIDEFREMLLPLGINVKGIKDLDIEVGEIVEDGDSFAANAIIKAEAVAKITNQACLADDSGLEVLALAGAPGIYSARYAGENATDADNRELLQKNMVGINDRAARFVCAIALAIPRKPTTTVLGFVAGTITDGPRGEAGFGYDPLFVPNGYTTTFAEMSSKEKEQLSHRGNALKSALEAGFFAKLI